jgi:hypothetical protein
VTLLRGDAPTDELVVVDVPAGDAADGSLAAALTEAFVAAKARAPERGCLVFRFAGAEAEHAGVSALTRTLALEWAPRGIRVNAVRGDGDELIRFLATPASRLVTGAVLDA